MIGQKINVQLTLITSVDIPGRRIKVFAKINKPQIGTTSIGKVLPLARYAKERKNTVTTENESQTALKKNIKLTK